MKQIGIFGVFALLFLPAIGCMCHPGYTTNGCYTANNCGNQGMPIGCGSLIHQGVVDYVDGGPGANQAECGVGSCGPCTSHGVTNCGSCLGTLGDGIRIVGEGAFSLAASPFILIGHVISGGGCGYENYANCGCSNEVYYGDNCYQQHDIVDPCASNGCDPCGSSVATSGCTKCSNGYTEGIQYEESTSKSTQPRPAAQPTRAPTPIKTVARPVTQTSYRRPVQQVPRPTVAPMQPKRLNPAQPQPPRPQTVAKAGEPPVLPEE